MGNEVYNGIIASSSINLADLPAGIYTVIITTSENKLIEKIVKR
jgi:hypothetical protein